MTSGFIDAVLAAIEDRFYSYVQKSDDCWLWQGGSWDRKGYGRYRVMTDGQGRQREFRAHRIAWELANGPVPPGLSVLHRCDNPACVRPDHLWLGSAADNARDAQEKGRIATKANGRWRGGRPKAHMT